MKPNSEEQEPENSFTPWDNFSFESYQALLKDRTILFNDDVKKDVIERIVLPLTTLSQKNDKPIKLLINSQGGSIEDGQAVVDAIVTSRVPIVTVAFGKAMSAAFDIFLAGDFRIVYPNTVLMCHSGSATLSPQTLPQINQEAKLHESYFERWSSFYARRTNISKKEWLDLLKTGLNRYFFPEESLAKGLVHQIITPTKKSLKNIAKAKW